MIDLALDLFDRNPFFWIVMICVVFIGSVVGIWGLYERRYPCLRGHDGQCTTFILVGKVMVPIISDCYVCDERGGPK